MSKNPMLSVTNLKRVFDVSAPWLNRMLEGKPATRVHVGVDGAGFSYAFD